MLAHIKKDHVLKRNKMEKILVRNLVSSTESDELYERDVLLGMRNLTLTEDEVYDYEIDETHPNPMLDDNYSNEVTPINIESLEVLLNDAKKKGATHVGVFYHGDHFQYEVYGYTYEVGGNQYLSIKKEKEEFAKRQKKIATIARLKEIAASEGLTIQID